MWNSILLADYTTSKKHYMNLSFFHSGDLNFFHMGSFWVLRRGSCYMDLQVQERRCLLKLLQKNLVLFSSMLGFQI
ncbi:unnamed protein product [Linum tenue]|uniref:Uncharacterized protein n=1 Tax=Linum tenue TaxID=586396 RepID=A0AAV0N1Z9_9ROSI|nr:unnamed protein product [Linum tenue]